MMGYAYGLLSSTEIHELEENAGTEQYKEGKAGPGPQQ
jgi:hypothetical protein